MAALQLLFLSDPAPCDNCKLADLCHDHLFSCEAFHRYVQGTDWSAAERYPGRDWYIATMKDENAALQRAHAATRRRKAA